MRRQGWIGWALLSVVLVFGLGLCGPKKARAELDLTKPVLVVAAEDLDGPYRGTVMAVVPWRLGHIGVVLNRPTQAQMGIVFNDHAASKAVKDPIHIGGYASQDQVVVVVKTRVAPSSDALAVAPGVWLEINKRAIDAVIERMPNAGRYYAGLALWTPGRLAYEVSAGYLTVRPMDPERLFLKDTSRLYEQLALPKGAKGV